MRTKIRTKRKKTNDEDNEEEGYGFHTYITILEVFLYLSVPNCAYFASEMNCGGSTDKGWM